MEQIVIDGNKRAECGAQAHAGSNARFFHVLNFPKKYRFHLVFSRICTWEKFPRPGSAELRQGFREEAPGLLPVNYTVLTRFPKRTKFCMPSRLRSRLTVSLSECFRR